jgi:hypothetical protein
MSDDGDGGGGGKELIMIFGGAAVLTAAIFAVVMYCDHNARKPFRADDYLADTYARARAIDPAAAFHSVEASDVDPDGRVHTEHGGQLRAVLLAPHTSAATAPDVLGEPHAGGGAGCHEVDEDVDLEVDESASLRDRVDDRVESNPCDATVPGPLGCTIAQLWQRAIAAGAPHPALATIKLATDGTPPARTWTFTIVDRRTDGPDVTVFEHSFPDACR